MPLNPALRLAERTVRERLRRLEDRMEPASLGVWEDALKGLQALRELIRTGDPTDGAADEAR